MGTVIVKMNGEVVRQFSSKDVASKWAMKHCRGKIEIISLTECAMPRACSRMYPNESMPDLRHRPFVSLA